MKAKQLAATAIKAKKAGNYLEKGNAINALRAVKNAEKTFNRKELFSQELQEERLPNLPSLMKT